VRSRCLRVVLALVAVVVATAPAQWVESTVFIPDSFGGLAMPNCLVYDPADNRVFVAGEEEQSILVLDAADGHRLARIPLAAQVRALCYNPINNKVYAAAGDLDEVAVIDAGAMQLAATIAVGDVPVAFAYNPALNRVYCVNILSYDVTVIDGAGDSVVATVPVGMYPYAACWNPGRNVVYIANSNSNTVSVIDCAADTVVAVIPTGGTPIAFVYNPDLSKLYVADYAPGYVTVIDGLADTVLATITGGSSPIRLCYNPVNSKVYVGDEDIGLMLIDCTADTLLNSGELYAFDVAYNAANNRVYGVLEDGFVVIDGATDEMLEEVDFGYYAAAVCVADSGRRAFGTADDDALVGVLDCLSDSLSAVVGTQGGLSALCLDPARHKVYVADSAANVVTVFNDETNTVIASIQTGQCPVALLYDSANNKVYCAGAGGDYLPGTIAVIDGEGDSLLKVIATGEDEGDGMQALCLNPEESRVYVGSYYDEKVIVVDANADTVIAMVTAGGEPRALCYNPAYNYVYAASSGRVGVIDCDENVLIALDTVGREPSAFCYVPVGARVYVANTGDSTVSVIAGERPAVIAQMNVGLQPSALCWDSMHGKVFCANAGDDEVAVIDAASNTVIARVPVGGEPVALSYDAPNEYVYCACREDNEVYVIDAHWNTVVTEIEVGEGPRALTWNPIELRMFVLNPGSSSVSVLRDSLHVGIEERAVGALNRRRVTPTVVRGVLPLPLLTANSSLLSIDGRKVMDLRPGDNDIRRLAPGVYFLRYEQEKRSVKIVVQR
jgi:YVTN family beta-propeller protein